MATQEFLTFSACGQQFGVAVRDVHDVLRPQPLTRVPTARAEIAGVLNLRGRIVTAMELRTCLNMPTRPQDTPSMHIVVTVGGELYGLVADAVGDVVKLDDERCQATPRNLDSHWSAVATGVYRLERGLLLILDVASLIDGNRKKAA